MNMETLDIIDALGVSIVGLPQTNVHLPKFLEKYTNRTTISMKVHYLSRTMKAQHNST